MENKENLKTPVEKVETPVETVETVEVVEEKVKKVSKAKSFLQGNEMARLVLVLLSITFVTALMLAGVNEITAPIIKERENGAVMEIMEAYFPAVSETEVFDVSEVSSTVKEHTRAVDGSGAHIGDVVIVGPTGFGGEVQIVVILDIDGTVKATKILSEAETPGIGTLAYEASFTGQFVGQNTTDGIDTIANATLTSGAYIKGVTEALEYIQSLSNGGAR